MPDMLPAMEVYVNTTQGCRAEGYIHVNLWGVYAKYYTKPHQAQSVNTLVYIVKENKHFTQFTKRDFFLLNIFYQMLAYYMFCHFVYAVSIQEEQ